MTGELLGLYLLTGAVAGFLAGLLGVGGGLIMVPALVFISHRMGFAEHLVLHLALGTSLATVVFNSISSIRSHHKRGAVLWPVFRKLAPGLLLGTLLGSLVAQYFKSIWLQGFFGIFAMLVAVQMLLAWQAHGRFGLPGSLGLGLTGGFIGLISAWVGIGGGSMTVPFLNACQVQLREAIGTSSACGLPIAIGGTLGYIWIGWGQAGLPTWSLGYVQLPALVLLAGAGALLAPLGARLAHSLPIAQLKRIFGLLLFFIGGKMLYGIFN